MPCSAHGGAATGGIVIYGAAEKCHVSAIIIATSSTTQLGRHAILLGGLRGDNKLASSRMHDVGHSSCRRRKLAAWHGVIFRYKFDGDRSLCARRNGNALIIKEAIGAFAGEQLTRFELT